MSTAAVFARFCLNIHVRLVWFGVRVYWEARQRHTITHARLHTLARACTHLAAADAASARLSDTALAAAAAMADRELVDDFCAEDDVEEDDLTCVRARVCACVSCDCVCVYVCTRQCVGV